MNTRYNFPIAILASLCAHATVIVWLSSKVHTSRHDDGGIMQVTLRQNSEVNNRAVQLPKVEANVPDTKEVEAIRKPVYEKPLQASVPINLPPEITLNNQNAGQFGWQPQRAIQQNQIMIAMQQNKLAQERELRKASLETGLSNLSFKLRPLVAGKIVCRQLPENEIKCIPEQSQEINLLLIQFATLAKEAHHLGITANPVILDMGPELGVNITLLP